MITSVIILCQGQQKRLPKLDVPKQMLRLPGTREPQPYECDCNLCHYAKKHPQLNTLRCRDPGPEVHILERTLVQLAMLLAENEVVEGYRHASHVELVGRDEPFHYLMQWTRHWLAHKLGIVLHGHVTELGNPGNSSLKGLAEYMRVSSAPYTEDPNSKIVVLFGDVVYSWETLRMCLNVRPDGTRRLSGVEGVRPNEAWTPIAATFCGTEDLSPSRGELWGLQWERSEHPRMMLALHQALQKHPPFHDYQPGQMRRLLYAWDSVFGFGTQPTARAPYEMDHYLPTRSGDYTRDIDLPEHVDMLPELAKLAIADDKEHGLVW